MNDWIKEEGEKTRKARQVADDKEYLIQLSNYWAVLRDQITKDVEAINANADWQHLFNEQISIENIEFGGLRLKKASFPAAFGIDITNGGDELLVKSYYKLDNDHSFENNETTLKVEVERGHVVVKLNNKESFLVPEQASQYILSLIVRAKDDSVKFFAERPYLNR